ncbi:MAG: hypothetical protein DRH37_04700 [Deltaproteobacteria bacterium]|nr:MAG: hypothetical protein DRH37_04700 [Deltaproteobacteria bacterium]
MAKCRVFNLGPLKDAPFCAKKQGGSARVPELRTQTKLSSHTGRCKKPGCGTLSVQKPVTVLYETENPYNIFSKAVLVNSLREIYGSIPYRRRGKIPGKEHLRRARQHYVSMTRKNDSDYASHSD